MSGYRKKYRNQPQYAMHRIFAEHYHQRTSKGQCRQEPKQDFRNIHVSYCSFWAFTFALCASNLPCAC